MKKIIFISISILLIVGLSTGCSCSKKQTKTDKKTNTNEDVIKDQELEGIKMTKTSLNIENGVSKLVTSVTNTTDKDYQLNQYIIIFKDKDGKEIVKIPGYVGSVIKAGETKTINSSIGYDLTEAVSIEYEVQR